VQYGNDSSSARVCWVVMLIIAECLNKGSRFYASLLDLIRVHELLPEGTAFRLDGAGVNPGDYSKPIRNPIPREPGPGNLHSAFSFPEKSGVAAWVLGNGTMASTP
jgi:hypothetical protein